MQILLAFKPLHSLTYNACAPSTPHWYTLPSNNTLHLHRSQKSNHIHHQNTPPLPPSSPKKKQSTPRLNPAQRPHPRAAPKASEPEIDRPEGSYARWSRVARGAIWHCAQSTRTLQQQRRLSNEKWRSRIESYRAREIRTRARWNIYALLEIDGVRASIYAELARIICASFCPFFFVFVSKVILMRCRVLSFDRDRGVHYSWWGWWKG